jgi:hypothetical protein
LAFAQKKENEKKNLKKKIQKNLKKKIQKKNPKKLHCKYCTIKIFENFYGLSNVTKKFELSMVRRMLCDFAAQHSPHHAKLKLFKRLFQSLFTSTFGA